MKQADTHETHTHTRVLTDTHAHRQPQVGPQCDGNNKHLLLFNEQTPPSAYSQLITCTTHPVRDVQAGPEHCGCLRADGYANDPDG